MQPKFNEKGLIPAIAQDHKTGEVLMMAYMNEESYKKTLETKEMWYFSRSRNKLWHKGETSGNIQKVKELFLDCDNDTILAKIEQVGGIACHTGNRSCFFNKIL
jgi:phosphoribosyl-AMP cyclohydrolase